MTRRRSKILFFTYFPRKNKFKRSILSKKKSFLFWKFFTIFLHMECKKSLPYPLENFQTAFLHTRNSVKIFHFLMLFPFKYVIHYSFSKYTRACSSFSAFTCWILVFKSIIINFFRVLENSSAKAPLIRIRWQRSMERPNSLSEKPSYERVSVESAVEIGWNWCE